MLSRNKISSSVSAVSGAGLAMGTTVSGIRIPSNREWQTCNFSIGGRDGWFEVETLKQPAVFQESGFARPQPFDRERLGTSFGAKRRLIQTVCRQTAGLQSKAELAPTAQRGMD